MKRFFYALITLLWALPALAQVPMTGAGLPKPTASGGAYTGPGDIATFTVWGGIRSYNTAYATGSNPSAIVCDTATFLTCTTINILSSGDFDTATASGSTSCAVACVVKQLYDQTGGGNFLDCASASACPTLTFNCLDTKPCMTFNGTSKALCTNAPITRAQPLSYNAVALTTGSANGAAVASSVNSDAEMRFSTSPNTIFLFAGSTTVPQTETDNTFHALSGVFNGASSVMNVDGSSGTPGNPGANGVSTGFVCLGNNAFGSFLPGKMTEGGMVASALSGANMTSLSSNEHTYWGF